MTKGVSRRSASLIGIASALVFASAGILYGQESAQKVKSIDIRGNKRIEATAVRGRLTLKVDDPYTREAVRTQIRLIYDMGFFEDVQVETEPGVGGVAVVFVVREKSFITEIVFDGNEHLADDKLREKVTIQSQSFLDLRETKESAEQIELAYQGDGYANVEVIPIIQSLGEDRKRLTFYIKEGKQVNIKTITFEGAQAISKKELSAVLANREYSFPFSLMTDAGILRREELANDVERIREIYMNKGYLNVQIGLPTVELTEDREWFTIAFTVSEGELFTVGEVGYRGNTVFEESELRVGSPIQEGDIFQRALIRAEIERVTDLYGARGYAFTEVTPSIESDPEKLTTKLIFKIQEGKLIRVRRIMISGNDKTRDNVIRRELRINEQEVIDTPGVKRSFQRLNNLNYFETVEILPKQVEEDKVDLDVRVKEKPTGSFSIGGGFSTLDQFTLIADITEANLFGKGWRLRVRGQLGQRRTLGLISFREPYFRDTLTSVQADVFSTDTNFQTYREEKVGGNITLGRWFSEYMSGSFSLIAEELEITDIAFDAPPFVRDQEGTQSTTGFRSTLSRDSRDNFIDPRTGMRHLLGFDFATPALGGTNHFYKITVDSLKYTPLFWDIRHAIRGRLGVVEGIGGKPEPLTELFFVGGINTVRGFEFGRAGPTTITGTLLGATNQVIINNDLIFPISKEAKLNGVLFFDYGKGFGPDEDLSFDLRPAAGVEARWISPFGPLRLAYGLNLDPQRNEKSAVFEFSVGNLF